MDAVAQSRSRPKRHTVEWLCTLGAWPVACLVKVAMALAVTWATAVAFDDFFSSGVGLLELGCASRAHGVLLLLESAAPLLAGLIGFRTRAQASVFD